MEAANILFYTTFLNSSQKVFFHKYYTHKDTEKQQFSTTF